MHFLFHFELELELLLELELILESELEFFLKGCKCRVIGRGSRG